MRPVIISISGPLGVGKTSVLRRCEEIVTSEHISTKVAYVNLRDRFLDAYKSRVVESFAIDIQEEMICYVLAALADKLDAKIVLDLLQRRSNLGLGVSSNADTQEILARAGGQVFKLASKALIEGFKPLPLVAGLLEAVGDIAGREQLMDRFIEVATRHKRERDILLLNQPKDVLADAFSQDMNNTFENHGIVVLLDDLEPQWTVFNQWLCDFVKSLESSRITLVTTSWIPLPESDWQIQGLELIHVPLERVKADLIPDDVWNTLRHFPTSTYPPGMAYTSVGPPSEKSQVIETNKEKGLILSFLPILQINAQDHKSDRTCCQSLALHFKDWLADNRLFDQLRKLAVARYFDYSTMAFLLGEEGAEIWDYLLEIGKQRFIRQSGMRRYLDPEIRYALLRYTQINYSIENYRDLHRRLVTFYAPKIRPDLNRNTSSGKSNIYNLYRSGIARLLSKAEREEDAYRKLLVYQHRLSENFDHLDKYGETPNLKAERSRVFDQLNLLALEIVGMPFYQFCNLADDPRQKKHLQVTSSLSLPYPLLEIDETNFNELFYHALSAEADPGPVLLYGLQRALLAHFDQQETSCLIDAIYQVADERHNEPNFLNRNMCLLNVPLENVGRKHQSRSSDRGFRNWGELLEECMLELEDIYQSNWDAIRDFSKTFVNLYPLNDRRIAPETKAEAHFWLAVTAYETGYVDEYGNEIQNIRAILSLSNGLGTTWWNETRDLAKTSLQTLMKKDIWIWQEWLV